MSSFWNIWIIGIVVLNIAGCAWLLMWTRKMNIADMPADGTTGHEYDGIREYNNPLPAWWLYLFWITIVFAITYLVLFPGLGAYKGTLGWTSHGEVAKDQESYQKQYGALYADFAKVPVEQLAKDARAMKIAGRLFANNCAMCHGGDAKGAKGFPNLTDADWLYGGTPDRIKETLTMGRNAMMPAWKDSLGDEGIKKAVHYVMSLSGRKHDAALAAAGADVFATNCAACHGADGKGNQMMGAPNLADAVWLYGGTEPVLTQTLENGRNGHMPAQKEALGDERIHLLTAYVWSLSNK